jgi:putative membrane protein
MAANAVVALVALLHAYFLVLEMFLWDKPAGLKAFSHPSGRRHQGAGGQPGPIQRFLAPGCCGACGWAQPADR